MNTENHTQPSLDQVMKDVEIVRQLLVANETKRPDQTQIWSGPLFPVAGIGFEPMKAMPADLQSAPFGRSGNLPGVLEAPEQY